ncbi:uncharacterized protein EAE97_005799 [Botrytis byssoidea]|uniref:Uncharacterized protein n=1 Tax=Botrytis byssoidea TaxID=139641 RepID=A0A9P5IQX5_9HELO|nr:uncharacterized protein EAE97_005799 [Botrytis byssoidea]KAF7943729.1 hypothetical protein EAE97_005799 [Botrytis byssoidea]
MTLSDHDDGSQSTQVEHVVSNHGDGSQSVQGKQADNNHDDGSQSIEGEQADSNHGNTGDNVQMIVDLEFSQLKSPQEIKALLQALIEYAAVIHDVKILIKAPKEHRSVTARERRIATVSMVISILNTFHLAKVEVIACLDDYDSFEQLHPTIAAYRLRLRNWTLAYEILGLDGTWEIPVDSKDELRLRRHYKKHFFKKS